jgi:hypothetical protein
MSLLKPSFVGWSKPLAQAVASCLLVERNGRPIDLGQHRVIVPSSFASRLIQEELAKIASGLVDKLTSGQGNELEARRLGGPEAQSLASGILLPEFQTPDKFLKWGDHAEEAQRLGGSEAQEKPRGPVASKETCLLAWVEVLTSPHFSRTDFPALFPAESTPDFTFDEAKSDDDTVMEKNGVMLLIDPMSYQYLAGAEIDYTDGLEGSQFVIKNPNATSTCGCGSSFSA